MATRTQRLTFSTKFVYGSGQATEGLKTYAFEVFLFFFYTQVMGLDSWRAPRRRAASQRTRAGSVDWRRRSWVMQRFSKRTMQIVGITIFVLQSLPVVGGLLDLWPISGEHSWPALCLTYGLAGAGAGAGFVGLGTMMADVADAHQHATGERSEGVFFGASTSARKSSSGFGALAAGVLLSLLDVSQVISGKGRGMP